jgi:hypothetical protein
MARYLAERLEARDITRTFPVTENGDCIGIYVGKAILGFAFYFFGLFAGTKLGAPPWLKDPIDAILALVIIFLPLNNEVILWWISELRDSRIEAAIHSGFNGDDIPTSPKSIEVGNYIRRVDYSSALAFAELNQLTAMQGNDSNAQFQTPSQSAVPEQTPPKYNRVIAKIESPGSGQVWIAAMGIKDCYDTDPADSRYIYYRRKASIPGTSTSRDDQASEISIVLDELIELLAYDGGYMSEEKLAGQLIKDLHRDPSAVRLALRIAEYGQLITRQRRAMRAVEQLRVFNRKAEMTGHANCIFSLTESGNTWERAASSYPVIDYPEQKGASVSNNFFGNNWVVGSIGNENEPHVTVSGSSWHNSQSLDTKALAQQLAALSAELRKQPASPEQNQAIAEVESAFHSAQNGDGAGTVTNLAKLRSYSTPVRKWVVDNATAIGVPIAIAAIKEALHLPFKG